MKATTREEVPAAFRKLQQYPVVSHSNWLPSLEALVPKDERDQISPVVVQQLTELHLEAKSLSSRYMALLNTVLLVIYPQRVKDREAIGEMAVI